MDTETRPILHGVADYARIRRKNACFVDHTAQIRGIEGNPIPDGERLPRRDLPFAATSIDFETTGSVPGFRVEPWQIGLFSVGPEPFSRENVSGSWLRIDARRPFNRHAPGRHAQLRDVLADSPTLPELLSELTPLLIGRPLIAHNAGTERSMLADAFPMHRFGPWIDTLQLARRAWPGLASYALEDLVPAFGLDAAVSALCPGDWEPHDARYDAVAAAVLLRHLLSQPGWDSLGLDDLLHIV